MRCEYSAPVARWMMLNVSVSRTSIFLLFRPPLRFLLSVRMERFAVFSSEPDDLIEYGIVGEQAGFGNPPGAGWRRLIDLGPQLLHRLFQGRKACFEFLKGHGKLLNYRPAASANPPWARAGRGPGSIPQPERHVL